MGARQQRTSKSPSPISHMVMALVALDELGRGYYQGGRARKASLQAIVTDRLADLRLGGQCCCCRVPARLLMVSR